MKEQSPHGFPFIPVAYHRDEDGPCWSPSQDACDGYEMSFSQMAQNNQAFGFPIMYLQGEGADSMAMQHDLNGTIKVITGGAEDKASFLSQPNASESFSKQLDTLYKMIYEQSFAVIPPELKSGDLPAAALKILYSPAYEKAMIDSAEYQPFLNDLVKIFMFGFGVEMKKTIDFMNLPINGGSNHTFISMNRLWLQTSLRLFKTVSYRSELHPNVFRCILQQENGKELSERQRKSNKMIY